MVVQIGSYALKLSSVTENRLERGGGGGKGGGGEGGGGGGGFTLQNFCIYIMVSNFIFYGFLSLEVR